MAKTKEEYLKVIENRRNTATELAVNEIISDIEQVRGYHTFDSSYSRKDLKQACKIVQKFKV